MKWGSSMSEIKAEIVLRSSSSVLKGAGRRQRQAAMVLSPRTTAESLQAKIKVSRLRLSILHFSTGHSEENKLLLTLTAAGDTN